VTPERVLVTGAAGIVGEALRPALEERYEVVAVDRRRGPGIRRAELARLRAGSRLFAGVDAVVDLAADSSTSISWPSARRNMQITQRVLEAARAHGVRRYVYASSTHVTGLYELDDPYARIVAGRYDGLVPGGHELISADSPPRPDGPYAVAKLFGEAAARYYAEESGMSVICLRIGTVRREDVPSRPRHFATLLTHRDLRELVTRALDAPAELRFGVYYGVSNNRWRFWRIDDAETDLGYRPADDAESFRD
jgi:nucleoside-diphosphate-sugar epimerase